tara:strand:- start:7428 stop:7835 length:408 start_codon:yes stop_codon:yes gene_type:complete
MKAMTLIDITETKQHRSRSEDKLAINQQANFMTFFQTLSMRFNPYYEQSPEVSEMTEEQLHKIGFGTDYKGKNLVWTFNFTIDSAVAGFEPENVAKDFDLVPVISGLKESILINNNVFRTSDLGTKNIIFQANDE